MSYRWYFFALLMLGGFVLGAATMRWVVEPVLATRTQVVEVEKPTRSPLPDIEEDAAAGDLEEGDDASAEAAEALPAPLPTVARAEDFDLETPLGRARYAVALAESVTPQNLEQILLQLEELKGQERWLAMQLVISQWGKFDPQGAFAYVQSKDNGRMTAWIGAVALENWAKTDPLAAFTYASENVEGRGGRGLLAHMASDLVISDPNVVLQIAAMLDDAEAKQSLLNGAVSGMIPNDPDGALELFLALEPGERSERNLRRLGRHQVMQLGGEAAMSWALESGGDAAGELAHRAAEAWADISPSEVASWYAANPDVPGSPQISREIAERYAREDGRAAANWANDLPPTPTSAQALAEAIDTWAKEDLDATAEWLNQQPSSPQLDPAIERYAQNAKSVDPEGALDWANSITDPARRESTMRTIADTWLQQDEAAASAWLRIRGLSGWISE